MTDANGGGQNGSSGANNQSDKKSIALASGLTALVGLAAFVTYLFPSMLENMKLMREQAKGLNTDLLQYEDDLRSRTEKGSQAIRNMHKELTQYVEDSTAFAKRQREAVGRERDRILDRNLRSLERVTIDLIGGRDFHIPTKAHWYSDGREYSHISDLADSILFSNEALGDITDTATDLEEQGVLERHYYIAIYSKLRLARKEDSDSRASKLLKEAEDLLRVYQNRFCTFGDPSKYSEKDWDPVLTELEYPIGLLSENSGTLFVAEAGQATSTGLLTKLLPKVIPPPNITGVYQSGWTRESQRSKHNLHQYRIRDYESRRCETYFRFLKAQASATEGNYHDALENLNLAASLDPSRTWMHAGSEGGTQVRNDAFFHHLFVPIESLAILVGERLLYEQINNPHKRKDIELILRSVYAELDFAQHRWPHLDFDVQWSTSTSGRIEWAMLPISYSSVFSASDGLQKFSENQLRNAWFTLKKNTYISSKILSHIESLRPGLSAKVKKGEFPEVNESTVLGDFATALDELVGGPPLLAQGKDAVLPYRLAAELHTDTRRLLQLQAQRNMATTVLLNRSILFDLLERDCSVSPDTHPGFLAFPDWSLAAKAAKYNLDLLASLGEKRMPNGDWRDGDLAWQIGGRMLGVFKYLTEKTLEPNSALLICPCKACGTGSYNSSICDNTIFDAGVIYDDDTIEWCWKRHGDTSVNDYLQGVTEAAVELRASTSADAPRIATDNLIKKIVYPGESGAPVGTLLCFIDFITRNDAPHTNSSGLRQRVLDDVTSAASKEWDLR